ncbi:MAG: hypothetical protein WCN88_01220 [Candidatus Falkowbacteria bacterium]
MWITFVTMIGGVTYSAAIMFLEHKAVLILPSWLVFIAAVLGLIAAIMTITRLDLED